MFTKYRTGNIETKLKKLSVLATILSHEKYNRTAMDILPNCREYESEYKYICFDTTEKVTTYEFTIGNITYGIEKTRNWNNFVYIKVGDIVIFHNREQFSCDGKFKGVGSGWNHTLPKEMMKQIKEDSKVIDGYIKEIKQYIKTGDTEDNDKHYKEQIELEKIFKNK